MKTTNRRPEVSTTEYRWAHGRNPSGCGWWHFVFEFAGGRSNEAFRAEEESYGAAKKEAVEAARARGAVRVVVAS